MHKNKHLDLGCGLHPRNPFNADKLYGIDIIEKIEMDFSPNNPHDIHELFARNIMQNSPENFHYTQGNVALEPLLFDDNSFDSVSGYDFLEHIPRLVVENNSTCFPFVDFMNEVYRVLKPNGIFYAVTPCYPREELFSDPTHDNYITIKTHRYFTLPYLKAKMYGFNGKFEVIRVKRTKFTQETKHTNLIIKFFKNILYTINYRSKTHIVWEFRAIK